jgi:hypothetical protein
MQAKLWAAFAAAIVVSFCADVAQAQRNSTFEEKLEYNYDPARSDDIAGLIGITSPEQCRAKCVADNRCRYWNWVQLGALGADPKIHANCILLRATTGAVRGKEYGYRYAGGAISDQPSTARGATPSPVGPTGGQLFPHPRPGLELVFQFPSLNNPNAERYAVIRFLGSDGDRIQVIRRAWEGPLSSPGTGADQTVQQIFDETPGTAGFSTCSLDVPERELRHITVGARLTYTRTCTSTFSVGTSRSVSTITRTVERNERVTVPAGTFDAVVVKKTTRAQYTSYDRDGDESETETAESELTRWWVPALGYYVKEQSRSRVVNRTFSQKLIDAYRRDGEPLRPRSTDWHSSPAMVLIQVR